jgi:hypothetical protein
MVRGLAALYTTTNGDALKSTKGSQTVARGRAAARFTDVNMSGVRFTPVVQAHSGGLFPVIGVAAAFFVIVSALTSWGAIAVNDSTGITGGLVFSSVSGAVLLLAIVAGHNIKLFATAEMVGAIGPFGGVRVCPRTDLAEIRTVWHWYQGLGLGFWLLPTLHFRQRDGVDAFATSAYLYRRDGLRNLAAYPRGSD